ncbi:MAG TPA: DMT family transporter [Spirochaetia bacterium]|nr:DMT family transporter [Spirochaetia bacterium]
MLPTTRVDRKIAILLLLITAVLWSLGGLLIKLVNWNPLAIAGMRSGISAVFLLIVIRRPRFTWSRVQIACGLTYAAVVILFVSATKLTTAANAILLQYTAPVYVALFSAWFLKERITVFDWLTILAVIGGLVLFFVEELTPTGFWGNVLGVCGGISFGWLTLLLRKQKHSSPVDSVILGNIMTAFICLPFMFGSIPDARGWMALLLMGVVQLGFPYALYAIAITRVRAVEAALIPVIEPILNPIWVFLYIGERPHTWSLVGGLIILGAITLRGLQVIRGRG